MESLSYTQRLAEAAQMEAIERTADNQAVKIRAEIATLLKKQKLVNEALDVDIAALELNPLQARLDAAIDRARQARLRLDMLEKKQANAGDVRVINEFGSRAEIVITYNITTDRKASYTRHVRWNGKAWVGRSTLSTTFVTYQVPTSVAQREAA